MQRRNRIALQKILEAIDVAEKILLDVSKEKFLADETLKLAMTMSILRVGELVKNLSQEFRVENNNVQWKAIAGFRDIIAHKYDVVDMNEVYRTIKNDFPELKAQIEKILAEE